MTVEESLKVTWKVWLVPAVIILMTIAGIQGSRYLSLPTLAFTYIEEHGGKTATVDLIVHGVRCYGTANLLRQHMAKLPGIVSLVAYASRHRVVIEYDPTLTSPDQIKRAIEAPIMTRRGPIPVFKVGSELKTCTE